MEATIWAYPEIERLGDIVVYHARHRPEALALRCADARLTWSEFDARTNRMARGLRSALGSGERRIAFLGRNSIAFFAGE